MSVCTVICTWVIISCNSFHLFFENQHIFCLRTNDNIYIDPMCVHPFNLRVYRGCTNTAGYK